MRVVMDCIMEISDWTDKEVYFDNWFPLFPLSQVFKDQRIQTTETVQTNHLKKGFQKR